MQLNNCNNFLFWWKKWHTRLRLSRYLWSIWTSITKHKVVIRMEERILNLGFWNPVPLLLVVFKSRMNIKTGEKSNLSKFDDHSKCWNSEYYLVISQLVYVCNQSILWVIKELLLASLSFFLKKVVLCCLCLIMVSSCLA